MCVESQTEYKWSWHHEQQIAFVQHNSRSNKRFICSSKLGGWLKEWPHTHSTSFCEQFALGWISGIRARYRTAIGSNHTLAASQVCRLEASCDRRPNINNQADIAPHNSEALFCFPLYSCCFCYALCVRCRLHRSQFWAISSEFR